MTISTLKYCTFVQHCLVLLTAAAVVKAFTMRHFGLWLVPDPPSYYEGNYLSYSPEVPPELKRFEIQRCRRQSSDMESAPIKVAGPAERLRSADGVLVIAETVLGGVDVDCLGCRLGDGDTDCTGPTTPT